jgi:hypothetical protein
MGNITAGVVMIIEGQFTKLGANVEAIFLGLKQTWNNVVNWIANKFDGMGLTTMAEMARSLTSDVDPNRMGELRAKVQKGNTLVSTGMGAIGDGLTGQGPQTTVDETLKRITDFVGDVLPVGTIGEFIETAPAQLQEFIGTTASSMADAIPGFRKFWAALTGATDPDMAAAGPAPEEQDKSYTWAERWKMALEEVKLAWTGLAATVKGKVQAMTQQYGNWDSVLTAGAKKSKKIAAVQKAIMIREALTAGKLAIMKAWSSAPFPANLPGVALTTLQTGLVIRDIMKGQAHDGHDSLPSTGTYMLEKGERVVSARVNKDLTDYLATSQSRPEPQPINFTISGVSDPDLVFNALQSRQGELTEMIRGLASENVSASPF